MMDRELPAGRTGVIRACNDDAAESLHCDIIECGITQTGQA